MMLRRVHFEFWRTKRPAPRWAKPFAAKAAKPSIHDCVNQHDPQWQRPESYQLQNTLNLLRGVIRRGEDLRKYLAYLCVCPGTVIDPEERSAIAARILRKLPPVEVPV